MANMHFGKFLRLYYNKITGSIAFYPALIAVGFLLLSWGMLEIDFSEWGKGVKTNLTWLTLKDASTARAIIATVAAAIMSLTVFSFSMVMIVLNQAASQMSNRVVTSMIENRFQQIILGFYIGTTVYALFLLSTIRDINSGIYVPALSIYVLIVLTVINIFLFIYFLDYVTQTVKHETVINRVRKQTLNAMQKRFTRIGDERVLWNELPYVDICSEESGYFQGFNELQLLNIAAREDIYISFLYPYGTFIVKGIVFMRVYCREKISEPLIGEMHAAIDFFHGQPVDRNPDYGFKQLAEIAIKALSPGINDPGTAVISLQALVDLFSYRLYHQLPSVRKDSKDVARLLIPASSFSSLFDDCIRPIWNYGKNDYYICQELYFLVSQLKQADYQNMYTEIFDGWLITVNNSGNHQS